MNAEEVLSRLREELALPFLQVKVAEKHYSEADYLAFKTSLLTYFEEYVQNVEN